MTIEQQKEMQWLLSDPDTVRFRDEQLLEN